MFNVRIVVKDNIDAIIGDIELNKDILLNAIGESFRKNVLMQFANAGPPQDSWLSLSQLTVCLKTRKGSGQPRGILIDTGILKNTVEVQTLGNKVKIGWLSGIRAGIAHTHEYGRFLPYAQHPGLRQWIHEQLRKCNLWPPRLPAHHKYPGQGIYIPPRPSLGPVADRITAGDPSELDRVVIGFINEILDKYSR